VLGKLLIPLLLLTLVLGVSAARADSDTPPASPPAPALVELEEEVIGFEAEADEEDEAEQDGEELSPDEECDEGTEEFEEGEIGPEELQEDCERERRRRSELGRGGAVPEDCLVRHFDSRAVANPQRKTVLLTVHYATFDPTNATIAYDARGLRIDSARRHLGARGVIHLREHLGERELRRIKGAHKLRVRIEIPSAPTSCRHYYSDSVAVRVR